jgi:hypothetical protein
LSVTTPFKEKCHCTKLIEKSEQRSFINVNLGLYSVAGILPHGMPEVKDVKPAVTKEEEEEEKEKREEKRLQELSEEEKQVQFEN